MSFNSYRLQTDKITYFLFQFRVKIKYHITGIRFGKGLFSSLKSGFSSQKSNFRP